MQHPEKLKAILNAIRGKRIVVIGDVMLDNYVWGDASRISPEAPVPIVKVANETCTAGGGANVAMNIAALGGNAALFGWIGDDHNGQRLANVLKAGHVEIIPGAISPNHKTVVKTRIICRRQQLCRLDHEADPTAFALDEITILNAIAPAMQHADAIIISDYGKGVITTDSLRAIQAAAPKKIFIALDPKPRAGIEYNGLSVMTPNRNEALRLAGISDFGSTDDSPTAFPADAVIERIRTKFSPAHLVITMGAAGMLVSPEGQASEQIPTMAREVFDVSGAGDTVIAALTLAATAGISLFDAARFANTAAGYVVGKIGTATATPEALLRYAEETLT